MRAEHAEHLAARRDACADTAGSVFEHKAVLRLHAEQLSAAAIRFRIWLAALHLVGADDAVRNRQPRSLQPSEQQPMSCRRDNGPTVRGQAAQQSTHASEHLEVRSIGDLDVFDQLQAFDLVDVRLQLRHDVDRADAVGNLHFLRVRQTVVLRPAAPASQHTSDRADEHAVHIEQQPGHFDLNTLNRHFCDHLVCPSITKLCAAARIVCTLSGLQLSQ